MKKSKEDKYKRTYAYRPLCVVCGKRGSQYREVNELKYCMKCAAPGDREAKLKMSETDAAYKTQLRLSLGLPPL